MYDVTVLAYFSIYFGATLVVVGVMMFRTRLLRIVYQAASNIPGFDTCCGEKLKENIKELQVTFFRDNEVAGKIKFKLLKFFFRFSQFFTMH